MRHSRSNRRAAFTVEFAVAAVVLVLFVFATIELGRVNMMRHTADNAAYEAARHVMVPGASVAEARALAQEILAAGGIADGVVTVIPDPIEETTSLVTVKVDVPVDKNAWIGGQFTRGMTLRASATLHTERTASVQANALPTPPVTPPSTPTPPPTKTAPTVANPPKAKSAPKTSAPRKSPAPPKPPAPRR